MKEENKEIEALFLDAIEGTLNEQARERFEAALMADVSLRESFRRYEQLCVIERKLANERPEAAVGFAARVMGRVAEEPPLGFFRRLYMSVSGAFYSRRMMRAVAACAVVVLCVAVIWEEDGAPQRGVRPLPGRPQLPISKEATTDTVVVPEAVQEQKRDQGGLGSPAIREEAEVRVPASVPPMTSPYAVGGKNSFPTKTDRSAEQRINEGVHESTSVAIEVDNLLGVEGVLRQAHPRSKLEAPRGDAAQMLYVEDLGYPSRTLVGGESYQSYGERPFVQTRTESTSTFSIDVDTGSYTNVRRMLRAGQLPPADAVRIEEFLNYFTYAYPVQQEKPFTLSYELSHSPLESGKALLKLGIKARDAKAERVPWNLVFLVDVSGSMAAQNKLPLVKNALSLLVHQMRPGDRVGIVTYAGYSGVALAPTDISNKSQILEVISRLGAGGSTAGAAGIQTAYELARRHFAAGSVNRVILATDGDFNVGITDRGALIKLIEEQRRSGVTLTTIGVGEGNLQEATMEQLANKGNGNYFYLDSFAEAQRVFQKAVAGTIEVVAKDVKLQMEFNPNHVSQYRLIGYENRALANHEFRDDKVDAGEIGSGHTVTALYELVLSDSELARQMENDRRYAATSEPSKVVDPRPTELGYLKIRFKAPDSESASEAQFPIAKSSFVNDWQKSSPDFRFAAAVSYFGHKLRGSQHQGGYSYADIRQLASAALSEDLDGERREFIQLVDVASALTTAAGSTDQLSPQLLPETQAPGLW